MKTTRYIGILAIAAMALVPMALASAAFAADDVTTESTAVVSTGDELIEQWGITNNTLITLTANIEIETCRGDPYRGAGGSGIVIDGQGLYGITQTCDARVLLDEGVEHVTLRGLTHFEGGFACGAGGGLYTNGAATVESSTINDNVATAQSACQGAVEDEPVGGGVFSDSGPTTVTNSTFEGNHADEAGGGFAASGPTTVTGSTFNENSAGMRGEVSEEFAGGGFATLGSATVSGSTFNGNFMGETPDDQGLCESCFVTGGGFWADDAAQVINSTFTSNHADCLGNCGGGGGAISADEDLTVGTSSFANNTVNCGEFCGASGGALYAPSTDVSDSSFTGNFAGCDGACDNYGGAIYTEGFDVRGSTFGDNHADCESECAAYGGAIAAFELSAGSASANANGKSYGPDVSALATGGWGGDVSTFAAVESGVQSISQSTFSGNNGSCVDGACGGSGGAVYLEEPESLTISQSTFDHNLATYEGGAVAVFADEDPPVSVTNSTITQNTSGSSGALTLNAGPASLAYNTIVQNIIVEPPDIEATAEGTAANITASEPIFFGNIVALPIDGINCDVAGESSQGYNFSDDDSCGLDQATDKVASPNDPGLGALAENGGPTQTMLPQTGSPVIDAIPPAACQTGIAAGVTVDQRGVTRPQGAGCEIGAVEVEVVAPPAPSPAVIVTPKFTG